jgi:hypothetical protein
MKGIERELKRATLSISPTFSDTFEFADTLVQRFSGTADFAQHSKIISELRGAPHRKCRSFIVLSARINGMPRFILQ